MGRKGKGKGRGDWRGYAFRECVKNGKLEKGKALEKVRTAVYKTPIPRHLLVIVVTDCVATFTWRGIIFECSVLSICFNLYESALKSLETGSSRVIIENDPCIVTAVSPALHVTGD